MLSGFYFDATRHQFCGFCLVILVASRVELIKEKGHLKRIFNHDNSTSF